MRHSLRVLVLGLVLAISFGFRATAAPTDMPPLPAAAQGPVIPRDKG
jgi:hypothetical protein